MKNAKFEGEVIFFDPKAGYGFLAWEKEEVKQKDMFVHFSDIVCDGFKTLKKGQLVVFELGTNNKGQPKAVEVVVVG